MNIENASQVKALTHGIPRIVAKRGHIFKYREAYNILISTYMYMCILLLPLRDSALSPKY